MDITFDPVKDAINLAKHGLSLAGAAKLDWENALVWLDGRKDYGEPRQCGLGLIGERVYYVAFVDRGDSRAPLKIQISSQLLRCGKNFLLTYTAYAALRNFSRALHLDEL